MRRSFSVAESTIQPLIGRIRQSQVQYLRMMRAPKLGDTPKTSRLERQL